MPFTNRKKINELFEQFNEICKKENITLTINSEENIPKRIEKDLCEILEILFPIGILKCQSCCENSKTINFKMKIIQNQIFIKFKFSWTLDKESGIKNSKKLKGILIRLDGYYKFFREEENYCIYLAYSIRKMHP